MQPDPVAHAVAIQRFPIPLVFPDVDADILAAEERDAALSREPDMWNSYLRRVLHTEAGAEG